MKLENTDNTKTQDLNQEEREIHITFYLPDGTMMGAWVYKGETIKEVIKRFTDIWYKKNSCGICPKCGSLLLKKKGKHSSFIACSNYPKCDYVKPLEKQEE